ncbi:hypothetical protein Bbelb_297600 [Branchiostoma belcheri]|nr:hypothetical protein Bbelb_297600 [Branchiostoma belcheri]
MVDFDGALVYLGAFGKYQKLIYCLTCVLTLPVSMHMLAMTFLDAKVAFHCNVPEIRHAEPGTENYSCALNYSIPWEQDRETKKWKLSGCERYSVVNSSLATAKCPFDVINATALGYFNGTNTSSCNHGYWYDTSQYHSSIFTEFDLVCGSSELNQFAQSMFMVGVLLGAVGSGQLSDIVGRKKTFFLGILMQLIFGVAVAFSPNYTLFVVFRAFVGASASAVFLPCFVIGTELVAPSMRTWAGTIGEIFFAIGYMLLALIAYFIRDWRTLQLVISVPNAVFLFAYPLVIESPRWLLSKGRDEEVAAIMRRAAKVNGVTLPDEVFTTKKVDNEKPKDERIYTVIDLVRTPNMAKKSLLIFFNWLVISLVYYGLSLNTSNLGGDDYLNFFISGVVEIPAYISSVYIADWFGRPKTHAAYMIIGAVGCIICPFLTAPYLPESLNALSITLAMIGKFGLTAGFNIIYLFTAELYPTMVRNVGVGASSMFARVGGIISPYVELSKSVWGPLPYIIFGALSFLAALAALLLPETLGAELPVTLEDGENFGNGKTQQRVKESTKVPTDEGRLGSSFLDAEVDYHCAVPESRAAERLPNETECVWNYSIPWERSTEGGTWRYTQCSRYTVTAYELGNLSCPYDALNITRNDTRPTKGCDGGYWYDTSQYKSSIFMEASHPLTYVIYLFNLVCERSTLNSLSQSIYMAGVLVGAIGFGQLSDLIGRKKTLFISLLLMLVFGVVVAFSPEYITFVIMRFIVGASVSGVFLSAFVIGTELTGREDRTWTGTLPHISFAIGYMLYALMAWGIRDWRQLQLAMALPNIILLFAWPWLLSRGRDEEAKQILLKAAKVNKVTIPDEVLEEKAHKKDVKQYTAIDLIRTPHLRLMNIICCYNWMVVSMVYYGLSLNTGSLAGNIYLNFFISGAVEIPAYYLSWWLLDIIGRLGSPVCDPGDDRKGSDQRGFNIVFLLSAELNPTAIRNVGVGAGSMFARLGGVISPFVVLTNKLWLPLPFLIFGGLSIIGGVSVVILPETLGAELPETLEEGENFGKKKKKKVYLSDIEKNGKDNQVFAAGDMAEGKVDPYGKTNGETTPL